MTKILLTGSHFTPAQAVLEELQKIPNIDLVYIGRKHALEGDKTESVESKVLPKLGVKFLNLTTGRLQRSFSLYTIPSLLKIPIGLIQAFYFLVKEQPDVVVSFGGYIGVPVVIAAYLLSIPVIVHDQTLVGSLSNRISGFFANKIAVSFDTKYDYPKSKTVLTGNPIRHQMTSDKEASEPVRQALAKAHLANLPVVYITGGNQGSHVINTVVEQVLDQLTSKAIIIHQTGDSKFRDFERLESLGSQLKEPGRYIVAKWFDVEDVGAILRVSSLVVTRGGINILSELANLGVPALVIPISYLNRNEQLVNAKYFEKLGLVRIILQSELNSSQLLNVVFEMLRNKATLKKSAQQAKAVLVRDATKRLVQEIILTTNG